MANKVYSIREGKRMDHLMITSPCFEHGGLISKEYTGYGADGSPELVLTGLSKDAVSIAIIMNDMDIQYQPIIIGSSGISPPYL